MATRATYPTTTGPVNIGKQIVNADGTSILDVYDNQTGAAVKITSLNITTDNDANLVVSFYQYGVSGGTNSDLLGSVSVPDLSGTNGVTDPKVNVLDTLGVQESDGTYTIWIGSGKKLQAKVDSAVTAAKTMWITGTAVTFV